MPNTPPQAWDSSPEIVADLTIDLGPSGDAGPHLMPQHVAFDLFSVQLIVCDRARARADDGHLSRENVDELRQFVQRRAAQECAEPGHARVFLAGLLNFIAVLANVHGAELPDTDLLSVDTVTTLFEKHGAW